MIYLKTPFEIQQIEYANKLGAELLQQCYDYIKPGIATIELENIAEKFCVDNNVRPSFKGYRGFPFCLCVSLNEEVVHGFPSKRKIEAEDIVSVDFGVNRNGYFGDAAFTKCVGKVSAWAKKLVKVTEECLNEGIKKAQPGNRINDISWAIQSHAERNNFDVIRDFCGHNVGFRVHEPPKILNYVSNGINWKLRPGMVIAIEPMLVEGTYEVDVKSNGWTVVTRDRKLSAHFEKSIAIFEDGPKIL